MQMDTDLSGLFGIVLAIFVLLLRVPRLQALPLPKRAVVLAGVVGAALLPLWGVSFAGFVRGVTGDLSITMLALLLVAALRSLSGRVLVDPANRQAALRALAIAALLFYPLALGLGMFDPYRLGYGNLWFMAALLAFALWSTLRYSTLLALCLALAVAAWSSGWYESPNLWDYLLDPWLGVYALAVQAKAGLMRLKGRMHAKSDA